MKRASAVFMETAYQLARNPKVFPSRALILNITTGEFRKGPGTWDNCVPALDADLSDLAVEVATTANITIATALVTGQELDGITLDAGMKVLVKNQTTTHQNGIYTVGAVPARSTGYTTYAAHGGLLVNIEQGSQSGQLYLCTSTTTGTLKTTAINWARKDVGLLDRSGTNQVKDMTGTASLADANLMMVEQSGQMRAVSLSTLKTYMNA